MMETRPLRFFLGQEGPPPREGEDVVLRLVERRAWSTLALPRDGAENLSEGEDIPWYFAAEVSDYARIMKGSEDYMLSSFDNEIEQIQAQEREDELMFGDETTWTRKAVKVIKDLKENVKGMGGPPNEPVKHEEKPARATIHFEDNRPEFYAIQSAAKSGQSLEFGSRSSTFATEQSEPSYIESSQASSQASITDTEGHAFHPPNQRASDSPYYFYQALLHYYLSPLDIRILRAAFSDYACFPSTILPRVERVSTGHVVDDDLRKRAKYLRHLPHGCEVGFLECDWTDLVSPDILAKFSAELDRRRKRNREKAAQEEKERIRAEKEEDDKRWAAARRQRPSVSKARDTSPVAFTTVPPATDHVLPSSISSNATSSSPPWGAHSRSARPGGAYASLASPSTSPSASRTVWGTNRVAPSSPSVPLAPPREPLEGDGWLQDWELDLLRNDTIDEDITLVPQLQAMAFEGGESSRQAPSPAPTAALSNGGNGGGKKKKNKKITLMSTNARRAA